MDTTEPHSSAVAVGPRLLVLAPPSLALVALREALALELDARAEAENRDFAAAPPPLGIPAELDHHPAHVGRDLNPEAHTFTLDFLAAIEGERFALRVVEGGDDSQVYIEWLLQLPELKRTYGFDTVAGLVVVRQDPHAQLAWQAVLARAYDATYFVDAGLDDSGLQALAAQIVDGLLDSGSTARLWDLWEKERTETDQREYVLGKAFLRAYVPVVDDPQEAMRRETVLRDWGQVAGLEDLLLPLTRHLDTLGLPYDRNVPAGVAAPLMRRYLPGFTWPLVIDNRFSLLYIEVPSEPVSGEELVQWTTLARCTRYWLDKAGDLRWNERTWVPLLVVSAPLIGQPYNPLSPVELLAGAGWGLITPAELAESPQRVREALERAAHRPAI